MNNVIKNIPIAISGTLLAVLSLGNLLNNNTVKTFTFLIGIMIILLLLLKLVLYNNVLLDELKNPVVLSTSGTFSMALMVLSTYTISISSEFSYILWGIGVMLHLLLIVYYTINYIIRDFNIENYYGSLWVVYIGFTMGAISGGLLYLKSISWIFFVFGFCVMIPSILLVSYRYIKYPVMNDANKPLICIYAAIFNILTVGYYYSFTSINVNFITLIYLLGLCLYIFSLYKLYQYIRLPFYPSYSAFTFPFVISAISTVTLYAIYPNNLPLTCIGLTQSLISVFLVIYVLTKYIVNIMFH